MVSHGHCYLCHSRTTRILFDQASCHNFQHRFLHHFNLGSLDSMCKTTWKRNRSRSLWRPFVTSRLRCSLRYVLDMVGDAKVSFLNSSIWSVFIMPIFSVVLPNVRDSLNDQRSLWMKTTSLAAYMMCHLLRTASLEQPL